MAKVRRIVRKVEPHSNRFFDEQLWPVLIALVALGGLLMGVSLAYQPLTGVAWWQTAWPSLIGIPLVAAAVAVALIRIDSRFVRRSLQFSLVLCAIVHVAFVVQMFRMHLSSEAYRREQPVATVIEKRPPKLVPEFHPTQLVPAEDRPRQDFEKPVESEAPQPLPEPEKIVRQPSEAVQSPTLPQPVPVPEQRPTTEPNVVSRPKPNEVAPRLAAQTSRLSKQTQSSQARLSQAIDLPAAVPESAAAAEIQPAPAAIERQQAEVASASAAHNDPTTRATLSRESQLTRRTSELSPAMASPKSANQPRTAAGLSKSSETVATTVAAELSTATKDAVNAQPTLTAATRQTETSSATLRKEEPQIALAAAPVDNQLKRMEATTAKPGELPKNQASVPQRSIASIVVPASAVVSVYSPPVSQSARPSNASAEPARLALQRAEAGVAGGRKSPNFETSLPGGSGPALAASAAARRNEATQRNPAGDALAPSSASRLARSRAGAEVPTSNVRAEQLEIATTAGTRQLAEATVSSSASILRADANGRRDPVTAAKGSGEIDFGPTQIVTEVGGGRASGGGQPELNLRSVGRATPRKTRGGGSLAALDGTTATNVALPAAVASAPASAAEVGPAMAAASRLPAETEPAIASAASFDREVSSAGLTANRNVVSGPDRVKLTAGDPVATPSAAIGGPSIGGSLKRATAQAVAGSATKVADIPEVGPRSAVAQAETDHLPTGSNPTQLTRARGEALAMNLAAPLGPGGLGIDFTPEVGINSRQAHADSLNVEVRAARFLRSQVGGLPAVSTAAIIPAEAFSSRAARLRGEERAGGRGSNSPQTEEAIERGLAFLARYQRPDGAWSLQGFSEGASLASDTAATALALLAFQGAGYNHREFQYKDVVRGGIAQLLKSQKENGDLFLPLDDASNQSVWLYSHSLAAIALCEAYGMTQDPTLREPAQKAIEFVVTSQEQERGGWRYAPGVGADTSVSGWMLMALKSGELAGLDVPAATYRRIGYWLDDAQQSRNEPHRYRYNPLAPDTPEQRHGRVASKTMTAVGLLMRLYTGWRRDDPNMLRGAAYLIEHLPAHGTARQPERDTYYWYYATQVLSHVGGEPWQTWMTQLHPLLVNSQIRQGPYSGSWDPRTPIADRWGPHAGRLYVTALNLLSLEVQYRKLPLYEGTSQ